MKRNHVLLWVCLSLWCGGLPAMASVQKKSRRSVAMRDTGGMELQKSSIKRRSGNRGARGGRVVELLPRISWRSYRRYALASKGSNKSGVGALPQREDRGWKVLSMKEAFARVQRRNLDLKILRRRIVQAELMRARAWVSLKPTLQAQGNYTRNAQEAVLDFGAMLPAGIPGKKSEPIVITPLNQWNLNLQLNWTFFNLQNIPAVQAAYLNVKQTKETAKQTERDVLYSTIRSYYGILLADGMVDIARQAWQNALDRLDVAKIRTGTGVSTRLNVMRARLDVVKAQQSWYSALNALRNTRLSLAVLLNSKDSRFRVERPRQPALPQGAQAAWLRQARNTRRELRVSRLAIEVAQAQLTHKYLQFVPTVALTGALRLNNAAGFAGDTTQWNIGLSAQFLIYGGGARVISIQEGHNKLVQARLEYAKSLQQIESEVKQAGINLRNAKMTLRVSRSQREIATETYQLNQQRYRVGLASPVDLSDALTQLTSAQISALREQLNFDLAVLQLQRAIGGLQGK